MCSLVSNLQYPIIGSDNGLAPLRRQAIIWTNDGVNLLTQICVIRPQRVKLLILMNSCVYMWLYVGIMFKLLPYDIQSCMSQVHLHNSRSWKHRRNWASFWRAATPINAHLGYGTGIERVKQGMILCLWSISSLREIMIAKHWGDGVVIYHSISPNINNELEGNPTARKNTVMFTGTLMETNYFTHCHYANFFVFVSLLYSAPGFVAFIPWNCRVCPCVFIHA